MNPLAKGIRDYLALRRGLGFKLARHEAGLKEFASFLARKRSSHITVALALEWATQHAHQQPAEWAAQLCVVRGFARYWSATDPLTEVPPLGLLPYRPARAQPYFYSDHEIRKLLRAAKTRPSIDPLRPWTYHCLFGLLAVELAVKLTNEQGATIAHVLAALFFFVSVIFVWRSFYAMRIGTEKDAQAAKVAA